MLANLPHVLAAFEVPGEQQGQPGSSTSALFLLDSGAGGVEVMFHARGVQELQLQSMPQVKTHTLKVWPGPNALEQALVPHMRFQVGNSQTSV